MNSWVIVVFLFSLFAQAGKEDWHLTIKFNDAKWISMPVEAFDRYAGFCGLLAEGTKKIDGFFSSNQHLKLNINGDEWQLFDSAAAIAFPKPLGVYNYCYDGRCFEITAKWSGSAVEKEKEEELKKTLNEKSLEQVASIAKVSSIVKEYGLLYKVTQTMLAEKIIEEIKGNPNKFLQPGAMNRRINALSLVEKDKKDIKEAAQEYISAYRKYLYDEKIKKQ